MAVVEDVTERLFLVATFSTILHLQFSTFSKFGL